MPSRWRAASRWRSPAAPRASARSWPRRRRGAKAPAIVTSPRVLRPVEPRADRNVLTVLRRHAGAGDDPHAGDQRSPAPPVLDREKRQTLCSGIRARRRACRDICRRKRLTISSPRRAADHEPRAARHEDDLAHAGRRPAATRVRPPTTIGAASRTGNIVAGPVPSAALSPGAARPRPGSPPG